MERKPGPPRGVIGSGRPVARGGLRPAGGRIPRTASGAKSKQAVPAKRSGFGVEVGKAPESPAEKKAARVALLPKSQRVAKVNVSWKNLTSSASGDGTASSEPSFSLFHNNVFANLLAESSLPSGNSDVDSTQLSAAEKKRQKRKQKKKQEKAAGSGTMLGQVASPQVKSPPAAQQQQQQEKQAEAVTTNEDKQQQQQQQQTRNEDKAVDEAAIREKEKAEADAKRKAAEEKRRKAEAEAKRTAAEEKEKERKRREAEEAEAARQQKEAEEAKRRATAEQKRKAEEAKRKEKLEQEQQNQKRAEEEEKERKREAAEREKEEKEKEEERESREEKAAEERKRQQQTQAKENKMTDTEGGKTDVRAMVKEAVREVLREELGALVAEAVRVELAKQQTHQPHATAGDDVPHQRLVAIEEQSATALQMARNLHATLAALLNPALFPTKE